MGHLIDAPSSLGLNRALVTTPWWPTNLRSFVQDPRFNSAAIFFLELKACVAQRTEPSGDHDNRRKCDVEAHPSNGSVTTSDSCQSATFHIRTVLSSPALDKYCNKRATNLRQQQQQQQQKTPPHAACFQEAYIHIPCQRGPTQHL